MKGLILQEGLPCICNLNQRNRELREKLFQQIPAGQVLQPLMRMGDLPLQRHLLQEPWLLFPYLPDGKPGTLIDILLKK